MCEKGSMEIRNLSAVWNRDIKLLEKECGVRGAATAEIAPVTLYEALEIMLQICATGEKL